MKPRRSSAETVSAGNDPVVLGDEAVVEHLPAPLVIDSLHAELRARGEGTISNPPRTQTPCASGRMVFTVGATTQGAYGFRAYDTVNDRDQAVVVWRPDGGIKGVVTGTALGPIRTGGLGATAVDLLARRDATRLAVIGTGIQAWRQAWAIAAVRNLESIQVFSPTASHRTAFARKATAELGIASKGTGSAREAVTMADIVVLATDSTEPVVKAEWISQGTHVNALGPKRPTAHELPLELLSSARVFTDSVDQLTATPGGHVFTDVEVTDLGEVAVNRSRGRRTADEITLFASVGLAGTEVALADLLLSRAAFESGQLRDEANAADG